MNSDTLILYEQNKKTKQEQLEYKFPINKPLRVAEDSFGYITPCPVCDKRIFDVTKLTEEPVNIRLKCPHCKKIVSIPITSSEY